MHTYLPPGNRLLVVDDQPEIRETLAEILEEEGFLVDTAANGRAALEYLQTSRLPSLMLLDLMMPVMSGWELVVRMREGPLLARTPFILITGIGDGGRHAVDLGASGYLDKPLDLSLLLRMVRDCASGEAV